MANAAPWPGLLWRCCRFDQLGVQELQRIHTARQQVFVIEQACAFLDADEADEAAFHLAAWAPGLREPVAYARVLDPGVRYAEASIGRVLTTGPARGQGLGREVVRRAVDTARAAWPASAIRISAQRRLEAFYAGFGFSVASEPYIEDGIPHIEMLLGAAAS